MITKAWKMLILNFGKVKGGVHGTLVNEKLTAILANTCDKFLRTWQSWLDYFPSTQPPMRFLEL